MFQISYNQADSPNTVILAELSKVRVLIKS